MADDLVQLAMAEANKAAPPVDDLLRELADELARLRAEVKGLREQHGRDSRELRELCAARDDARRERDELRWRIAVAPIVEAEPFRDAGSAGSYPYAAIALTGEVAKELGGQRVALVLLDTEEAK